MGRRKPSRKRSAPASAGVTAKKFLGQHFLKDQSIAEQIANSLSLENYSQVVEIGPGTGVLTQFLLARKIDLLAVELDRESVAYLRQDFFLDHPDLQQYQPAFTLMEADVLKTHLPSYFEGKPFAITGNFPYNISSQILFKTLEWREQVPEFSGMFQKEVAERICAGPGSKTYGILSVLVQAFYTAEYLFSVPPHVFQPPPKVDSGVIRLQRRDNYRLSCDEALFFRVVKAAFNQRRKTLRNSLKTFQLSDYLKEDAIFDRRPEQLAVPDFIALTEKIGDDTV